MQSLCPACKNIMCLAELDGGVQGYGGYPGDMPMDVMDGPMMMDDYQGSMVYDRQAYS